jgi:very-short-patch-repair endonuclease
MRRLREGRWWRPTDWTVALRTEFPDPDFDLLVASAHVWPDGGIGGTSLPLLFALGPAPSHTEVSLPRPRHVDGSLPFLVRRRTNVCLTSWTLPSGREISVDIGPISLIDAATQLTTPDVAWLLIRAVANRGPQVKAQNVLKAFTSALSTSPAHMRVAWAEVARAVGAGCESAGEVYVWHILESLCVRFATQHHIAVSSEVRQSLGAHHIRTDFVLDGDVLLEVDSSLHQHIKDVRRDLWNLTVGRRTLRIVGADVIADPVRAQEQLAAALTQLGITVRPRELPPWLTAP